MTRLSAALLCAGLLAALAGSAKAPARAAETAALPPALEQLFGGEFSLVDHQGERRGDSDFRGRYLLIYFGYTYCPSICPTGLQAMSDALDLLGPAAEQVQPLFITIDPQRDTVAALNAYVMHFHPRLLGLTGSEAEIAAVARAYRVHRHKVLIDDAESADDYLVDHSSITHLMGPDGKFLTLFPHGTDAETMAAALDTYVK